VGEIFFPIEHSRTADEVAQQIENLILEGVLRTGDRLPGERDLAQRLEVSRPILRDALKALETRGLLSTRHGGGTQVADVDGNIFARPVAELMTSHTKARADYLEFRREMEGIAAEYAARRITSDDRALFDRIMSRMEEAHQRGDFHEEAEIDTEFHNAIGEYAHNIVLLHTLRSCYRLLSDGVFENRLIIFSMPGAREQLLQQHRAIHDAITAGDPDAARRAAMDHITFVEQATSEAERTGDWLRVSRLRLRQRLDSEGAAARKTSRKSLKTVRH
jgi:GntR family transcriptional repressor for pyruvate dehydrogenase complex